jgi:hypothetical protein
LALSAINAAVAAVAQPAPVTVVLRRKAPKPAAPKTKHAHIEWAEDVVEINEYSNKRKSKSQQTTALQWSCSAEVRQQGCAVHLRLVCTKLTALFSCSFFSLGSFFRLLRMLYLPQAACIWRIVQRREQQQ